MAVNWGPVGQQLATMGQRAQDAYENRLGALVTRGRAEQQLGQEIMKTQAIQKLEGNLIAAGYSPEQARVVASASAGGFGSDLKASEETLGKMAERGYRQSSVDAARAGDFGGANAYLFGVASGPQALATVEGQNLINNRFLPGGGGISTTEQGQAGIGADRARAAASYASARSSDASAKSALGRLAIAQGQFDLQRQGQWNPSGKAAGGGKGGATDGLNDRQRVAVQGVQRNLIQYAAALTGKTPDELAGLTSQQIADLVKNDGGRTVQGGLGRTLARLPGGGLLGEVANSDILSYSQGAGAAWAAYENPTGIITNADRETATAQMPNYLDPPQVQAAKIKNFLDLSGWGGGASPSLGTQVIQGPAPSGTPRPGAVPAPSRGRQRLRYNPATGGFE